MSLRYTSIIAFVLAMSAPALAAEQDLETKSGSFITQSSFEAAAGLAWHGKVQVTNSSSGGLFQPLEIGSETDNVMFKLNGKIEYDCEVHFKTGFQPAFSPGPTGSHSIKVRNCVALGNGPDLDDFTANVNFISGGDHYMESTKISDNSSVARSLGSAIGTQGAHALATAHAR